MKASRLKAATILAAALTISACAGGGKIVSDQSVQETAEAQWTELLEKAPLSADAVSAARIGLVAERLLVAAGEAPSDWRVAYFDSDKTVNAFALPNRSIGVFSGIVAATENNDQLAAVIAHEIAHVQLRHAEARVNREIGPRVLIGVAQLPGQVIDINAVQAIGGIAEAGLGAGLIYPFDRQQELDADLLGLKILSRAGFDPREASRLWTRIAEIGRDGRAAPPEFLSTHPSDDRRRKALEEAIAAATTGAD